jgi:putative autotransporter adhesin-like protein
MKKLLSILFILVTVNSFGQTFKVQLKEFDELKVSRGVQATLIKSASTELEFELKGLEEDDIIIEQSNHRLTIKVRTKSLWEAMQENDWSVKVKVPYQDIALIDVSTGAVVTSESVVTSEDLFLDSSMGGVIKLKIKTRRITIDSNMGAVTEIEGETETANIDSNMGAVVKAFKLIADNARVEASMGSIVKVYCTKEFDGSASMGAEISVKGNPEKSYENESMGGDIDTY